jgi:hypothetical protein
LYFYLDEHPEIYMSPVKEPNYFSFEIRPENFAAQQLPRIKREMEDLRRYVEAGMEEKRFGGIVAEWEDYLKLFRNAIVEKAIGEASVCYLWSGTAARNIAQKVPAAKILIVLRNPADRAYSQYLHGRSVGMVQWSFREHIQANLAATKKIIGPSYPFLEMGMYFEQVTRYLNAFPKDNVLIFLYEEFRDAPASVLSQIYRWLGVDEAFRPELTRRELEMPVPRFARVSNLLIRGSIWRRAKNLAPKAWRQRLRRVVFQDRRSLRMDTADRAFLVDYYRHDILKLSSLLDRDLSGWLAV